MVTTGQQPGLFTGPAYTISKALSARALARALEARWKRPVVPVFWVPGDDHDFEESSHTAWIGGDGELHRAALSPRAPEAPLDPMARVPLGPSVDQALDAFEASFPDAGTRAAAVDWLRRHYRPEATVAGAFATALAELLAPLGILCLDSTHAAVKAVAAPLVLSALENSVALDQELAQLSAALVGAGKDSGVPVGDGASLAFLETRLGRDRLVATGAGFQTRRGREPLTLADLAAIAKNEPHRLSGNVLLRPVIESAILPTVAYVAGPGELRYLALAEPVYRRLSVERQLPTPRWSGLLLEPRVSRILEKFGARLEELTQPGSTLETRVARGALPEGSDAAFERLRQAIESAYRPVIDAAREVDPTLERPAGSAMAAALHGAAELEKKLLQHARKRQHVELEQVARARRSVLPDGKPQERVISLAGFLARYGLSLLEDYAKHIDAWYARGLEGLGQGA